jgi:polar amino acid transport system permease protein
MTTTYSQGPRDPTEVAASSRSTSRLLPILDRMSSWPWYLLILLVLGLMILLSILTNARMAVIFRAVAEGAKITIGVSVFSYGLALIIGLLVGLARVSYNKVLFNLSSLYVEIVRGVPVLVLLMYIAFVIVPLSVDAINSFGQWLVGLNIGLGAPLAAFTTRQVDNTLRVAVGLGIAYGAFEAEIFRAGIQSIEKGQMEAARALGMSYFQAMRYIILPQAIRRVLPALGNDFVAMVKDSSLVSVLGVGDITQLAKLYASSTFLFFQTYSILAFIYLTLTILLTRGVRALEGRLSQYRR